MTARPPGASLRLRSLRRPWLGLALAGACGTAPLLAPFPGDGGRVVAAAQDRTVESIESFLSRKGDWEKLTGETFRIEGRVGVLTPDELRFQQCDLPFKLSDEHRPVGRRLTDAEVEGTLEKSSDGLIFRVAELKAGKSDAVRLRDLRARIDTARPDEWYSVSDWAQRRGTFYSDQSLLDAARELRELGLLAEHRRLQAHDVEGRLALAAKAADWGLVETSSWRYLHETCLIDMTGPDAHERESVVLTRLLTQLPGAETPLVPDDEALRRTYNEAPQSTYLDADAPTRRRLHRILYSELLKKQLEREAQAPGPDYDALAGRIEQQIPEFSSLAQDYRVRAVERLLGRIARLSRNELLMLIDRLGGMGWTSDRLHGVKADWLHAREQRLRNPSAQDDADLAADYESLLSDVGSAARLHQSAWKKNPQLQSSLQWFEGHGYTLQGGAWKLAVEAAPPEPDRFASAVRDGRVVAGMTADHVRQALGARPGRVIRQATQAQISEIWIYREQGIAVLLSRLKTQDALTVVRVGSTTVVDE